MKIKPGVQLSGVQWPLWIAAAVNDYVRQVYGLGEGTITGAREGADPFGAARVMNTMHPSGQALDFRTNDLPGGPRGEYAEGVAQLMRQVLGADYQVIVEADHIHVELAQRLTT